MSNRTWIPIALLLTALFFVGPYPADKEVMAAVRRGDEWAAARRYSAAIDAYQDAAARCPGCPAPRLRLGEVYAAQGRDAEAWTAYLAAARLGGMRPPVIEGLAGLYDERGRADLATEMVRRLLRRQPNRTDLWLWLGEMHEAAGEDAAAREAFEQVLLRAGSDRQRQAADLRLGILSLETDRAAARAHLEDAAQGPDPGRTRDAARLLIALRVEEGSAVAAAKLGEALLRQDKDSAPRRLDRAREQFARAVEADPGYAEGRAYLGHVLSLLGKEGQAERHLLQAMRIDPSYPLTYYFMGTHYLRKGWTVTARAYLLLGHEVAPLDPAFCAAVADTYLRQDQADYGAAERWLHAAVDRAPDDVRFHLLLAHFYVDYNVDPGLRGVAVARVAVQLAPDEAEAQETLGWAYLLSGQPQDALPPLQRALALDPASARIHHRLGEVYRALGQAEQARAAYQQALDLDWNGPIGARARRALEKEPEN